MRRFAWIVGFWLVAGLHAHAQDALPLELQWQAPAECPSATAVRAELARIARARPGSLLTPLGARAEVERRGTTYLLTLQTDHSGEHGERRLEAADCKTLVRTLTLILALTYGAGVEMADHTQQPTAALRHEPQSGPARPPPQPPATEAQRASYTDSQPPASDIGGDRPELAFWLGGGIQLGLLPTAALATSAGVEWRHGVWSLGLQLTAWPAVATAATSNVDARFDGLAGELRACRGLPVAALMLGLCAGAQLAALRGRSDGATSDGSAVAPWYAWVAAATVSWPRGSWLAGRIEAGLAGSLDRPRFNIDGVGTVHRVPTLVGQFDAQLLITL